MTQISGYKRTFYFSMSVKQTIEFCKTIAKMKGILSIMAADDEEKEGGVLFVVAYKASVDEWVLGMKIGKLGEEFSEKSKRERLGVIDNLN